MVIGGVGGVEGESLLNGLLRRGQLLLPLMRQPLLKRRRKKRVRIPVTHESNSLERFVLT